MVPVTVWLMGELLAASGGAAGGALTEFPDTLGTNIFACMRGLLLWFMTWGVVTVEEEMMEEEEEDAAPWGVMRPLGSKPFWDTLDCTNGLGCLGNVIVAGEACGTVKLGWEDMDTMMLELPVLTVLMTLLAPWGWGAIAGVFTNFTPPVVVVVVVLLLPFKLCNPGEAVAVVVVVVVMMLGLGAVTTEVLLLLLPAGPGAVARVKLAAGVAKVTDPPGA